jgi:hypothetical protein
MLFLDWGRQVESGKKNGLMVLTIFLSGVLFVSLLCNIFLAYYHMQLTRPHNKALNFYWSPEEQNITVGKMFWLNFTFMNVAENLSITVRANDDDNELGCVLIMVFDRSRNGRIDYGKYGNSGYVEDTPYYLRSDNKTLTPWVKVGPKGEVAIASGGDPPGVSKISPWHTCTYSNLSGFTFDISLPLDEIGPTGIVYVIFWDPDNPRLYNPDGSSYRKYYPGSMYVYMEFSYL